MKSEKEGINRLWTKTILAVKEYSPLDVRGLCSLVERTIFVFKSLGIGRRTVLSRATKRHFEAVET